MKKASIIGFGYWGPKVYKTLISLKIEVKYICDLNKKNFDKQLFQNVKFISDIDLICRDNEINSVYICTEPKSHFHLCKMLLKSRKNVFVEKPICTNIKQFKILKKLATENRIILYEDLIYTKSNHIIYLENLILKKKYKPFLFQTIRSNLGKVDFETDVIEDLSHHDLSIVLLLFKRLPTRCFAKLIQPNNKVPKSIAEIYLEFGNKLFCTISLSWYSPIKIRKIFIHTETEMIDFDDIEPDKKIKIFKRMIVKKHKEISYRLGGIIIPNVISNYSPLENSINEFNKLIKTKSKNNKHLELSKNILIIKTFIRKSLSLGRFVTIN